MKFEARTTPYARNPTAYIVSISANFFIALDPPSRTYCDVVVVDSVSGDHYYHSDYADKVVCDCPPAKLGI